MDGHTSSRAQAMSSTYHVKCIEGRHYRPFPLLLRPADEAEGAALLRELPDASGVMLFGALRDLMLWLLAPQEERASLFPRESGQVRREKIEGAEVDPDLLPLLLRAAAVTDAAETHVQADVGALCAEIAAWATANDLPHTELAFTQACAIAQPEDPSYSLRTSQLSRDLADYPRAETWFRYTIKVARQKRLWDVYVDAFLGIANLYGRTGNLQGARIVLERALRRAHRWRLRELRGAAHHDLFHLCAEAGEIRSAYGHARAAQDAYGTSEKYLIRLAADLALFWVHLGSFERAVTVFDSLIDRAPNPTLAALWGANLTRASALAGYRDRYESARRTTEQALYFANRPLPIAESLVLVAMADIAMGEWERARQSAAAGLAKASAIGAHEVQLRAEQVLDQIREGSSPNPRPASDVAAETPGITRLADTLAKQIADAFSS